MIRMLKKPGILRSLQIVTLITIVAIILTIVYFYIFPPHNYYCNNLEDLWVNRRYYRPSGMFPGGRHCSCPAARDGILLTFDDGPTEHTPVLLDNLARLNVTAIFFVSKVHRDPGVLRRTVREGHTVCSHSFSHENFKDLEEKGRMDLIEEQLFLNQQLIYNITGSLVTCFRPPYGQMGPRTRQLLLDRGYTTIMWNSANTDWDYGDTRRSSKEALAYRSALRGGISCWHDSSPTTCRDIAVLVHMIRDLGSRVLTPRECFR